MISGILDICLRKAKSSQRLLSQPIDHLTRLYETVREHQA